MSIFEEIGVPDPGKKQSDVFDQLGLPRPTPKQGGLGSALSRGIDNTVGYGKISLTDDPKNIAGIVSGMEASRPAPTPAQQQMQEEIAPYAKAAKEAQGIGDNIAAWGGLIGKRASQLISNPKEAAGMMLESLPNSAPGIAAGLAGGAAGGAAGAAVAGVGAVPGALIGSVVGGAAGGYGVEQGSAMYDQIVKEAQARGVDPKNAAALEPLIAEKYPEFLKASRLKGVGTAGTDALLNTVTLGVAGIGERALKTEAKGIAKLVESGMPAEQAAKALSEVQAKNAARNTLGAKAIRGGAVVGAEMAGEGLSEAAGQKLAYGEVDPLDVADESLLGLGQGAAMAAGRKAVSPIIGVDSKGGVEDVISQARKSVEGSPQGRQEDQQISGLLPSPTYTGTPNDQLLRQQVEQQNAVDAAQASSDALWQARQEEEARRAAAMQAAKDPNAEPINYEPGLTPGIDVGGTGANAGAPEIVSAGESPAQEPGGTVRKRDRAQLAEMEAERALAVAVREGRAMAASQPMDFAPTPLPDTGPLSRAANLSITAAAQDGQRIFPFTTQQGAERYLAGRADRAGYEVAPHPTIPGRFAILPAGSMAQQAAQFANESAALRQEQLAQEENHGDLLSRVAGQVARAAPQAPRPTPEQVALGQQAMAAESDQPAMAQAAPVKPAMILTKAGKPWPSKGMAAANAKKNPGYSPVQVQGGWALQLNQQEATNGNVTGNRPNAQVAPAGPEGRGNDLPGSGDVLASEPALDGGGIGSGAPVAQSGLGQPVSAGIPAAGEGVDAAPAQQAPAQAAQADDAQAQAQPSPAQKKGSVEIKFAPSKVEDSRGNQVDGFRAEFDNSKGGKGYIEMASDGSRVYPTMVDNGMFRPSDSTNGAVSKVYEQAIQFAQSNGLAFTSDDSVTTTAARVYESLERKGYKVEKNKNSRLATAPEVISDRWVTDDGAPVFTVSKPSIEARTSDRQDRQADVESTGQAEADVALLSPAAGRVDADKVDVAVAQRVVDSLLTGWRNAPDRRVVATADDLPAAVREELAQQGEKSARGVFHGGIFYIVADEHTSEAEVEETVFHEVWSHYGLRSLLGAQTTQKLAEVFDKISSSGYIGLPGKDAFRAFARRHGFHTAHTESMLKKADGDPRFTEAVKKRILIEELVAKVAEKGEPRLKQRVLEFIGRLREWLRSMGFGKLMSYNDADLMRLVQRARDEVKYGEPGSAGKGNMPAVLMMSGKSAATADGEQIGDGRGVFSTIRDWLKNQFTQNRGFMMGTLSLDQIDDIYGKEIPAVREFSKTVQAMDVEKQKIADKADALVERWRKLDQTDADKLADVMHQATLAQVDPDTYKPTKLEPEKAKLRGEFLALSDEAKQLYRDVRDAYKETLYKVRDGLSKRAERAGPGGAKIAAEIRLEFDKYLEEGPYFPLARFGDFLLISTKGDERIVEAFETVAAREKAMRQRKMHGFKTQAKHRVEFSQANDGAAGQFAKTVLEKIDGMPMDADTKAKLMDDLNQLAISSLPDASYRKHFAHRKGVAGFSNDAMRAFASSQFHAAHHIARINHADRLGFALDEMNKDFRDEKEADTTEATQVLNELKRRMDHLMNPTTHPLAAALGNLGFVMSLGGSIASGLTNLSQTPLVAFPVLGARYGFDKASGALLRASKDYFGGKWDKWSGWVMTENASLSADEKDALVKLQAMGKIDLTQAHDLAGVANTNQAASKQAFAISRAMKIIGWTFHLPEVFNRQVTALAAYRLAKEKGMAGQVAIDEAARVLDRSHFNYAASNRARIFQGNMQRVITMFKQYSQNMTYLLWRNTYLALKGEDPEVRKEARRMLMGVAAMHFAAAGTLGLPLGVFGVSTALLPMLAMGMGDDDDPWDWEVEYRNMLAETFGTKGGEVIAHGPLRAIIPWADFASRVGLGDLWVRGPNKEMEGRAEIEAWMLTLLGPVAGYAGTMGTAMKAFSDGKFERGVEAMMPKMLSAPLKAGRYATEGVRSMKGDDLGIKLDGGDILFQAIGFTPTDLAEMYEGRNAIKNREHRLEMRRSELVNQWVEARRAGDQEGMREAMQEANGFSQKNPSMRITLATMQKAFQTKERNAKQIQNGVFLSKKREGLRAEGAFADL